LNIQQAPSPNFRAGRKGRRIIAIVNHITAGLMPGTLSWLRNPQAQASAHYLVTKKGEIFQMVNDSDMAWHAGIVKNPHWPMYDGTNPNFYTIGIEHEALAGEVLTEPQYQATLWLHRQLVAKYGIPVDQDHIIGHYRLDSVNRKNDPGSGFPWDRLFKDMVNQQKQIVKIKAGGKVVEGVIIENESYAPIRALVESLGRVVEWDAAKNVALIPPVTVQVLPGAAGTVRVATGNAVIHGCLIDGKAFAPVRELAKALGHRVDWDVENRIVIVQ